MERKLILASSSPRRQELLQQVRISYSIRKPEVDESIITIKDPVAKVEQLAALKGKNVEIEGEGEVILAADTVVSYNNMIYEKPRDQKEAVAMLRTLSGSVHDVYTGVLLRSADEEIVFTEKTAVEFWELPEDLIEWYTSTSEPYDKAGAYGIQSLGAILVKEISGDYFNVVGLPLARTVRELRKFDIFPKF